MCDRGIQQGGLAHARLSRQQQRAAGDSRPIDKGGDVRNIAITPDQRSGVPSRERQSHV
jgi:hypothetical protein